MPPRLRPTRLEHVVDGHALRARLSAAALDALGDEAEQRRRALDILKGALQRGRMIAKERLESEGHSPERLEGLPLFAGSAPTPVKTGPSPVEEAVGALEPDGMSPREAMEALYRLRGLLG